MDRMEWNGMEEGMNGKTRIELRQTPLILDSNFPIEKKDEVTQIQTTNI